MKLSNFTPWQWELAIVASRFQLGLLSDGEMIAFTHKLMDNGYYDDVMLDIIDDDPLYRFRERQYITKYFDFLLKSLGIAIDDNLASWLLSFVVIYPFTSRPFNFNYSYIEEFDYYLAFDGIPSIIKDDSKIQETYLLALNNYDELPIGISPLQNQKIIQSIANLYQEFENWLTRNQPKILAIMHQLFPPN